MRGPRWRPVFSSLKEFLLELQDLPDLCEDILSLGRGY